ncbi:MAG: Tim44/TimA family putative adaptor protein, partial [Candidatus Puniceispirillum sp.]
MPYIDIIIFAVIAVLLVLRLKSVLGQRTGFEQPQEKNPIESKDGDVVPFPGKKADSINGHGLDVLRKVDRNFTEAAFLGGATQAFEMVLRAYAEGDLAQLKRLLGYDLLQSFTQSIQR